MEPSRKSHEIDLSLFLWHEAVTIHYLHAPVTALMFCCSGTQI